MKVRSITSFYNPSLPGSSRQLDSLAIFSSAAVEAFRSARIEVQTLRLATTPFSTWLPVEDAGRAVNTVVRLEEAASRVGFAYLGLGPALPHLPLSYELILPILKATQNVFLTGVTAMPETGIQLPALQACARIIEQAATITPDGFTNLRFAALANVQPYSPFLPAAYAGGAQPAFALALEAADLALQAFQGAASLAAARQRLLEDLNKRCAQLERIAGELAARFGLEFKGIDCSLAPFPEEWCSIGAALESLGLPKVGQHGSLAAAAFLADTLDRGSWKKTGFNGLMLPVLEDSTLAARSGDSLGIKDLLLFSAVCGTGLDTVPLPGDVTAAEIEPLLLDVAALALRLHKPLTARLMPVPDKAVGDLTTFDFAFFSNGRVMNLVSSGVSGVLHSSESVEITPRKLN